MTLTQTAILTKQVMIISGIVILLSIISFFGYKIWHAYYLAHLPQVEEKPDTKFGLLPPPDFPPSSVSTSNYTYSLDTTTGGLPKLGDAGFEKIFKVYFVVKSFASLLSAEKSQALAEKFAITSAPQILSETKYQFQDKGKTLTVDLDTGNFTYSKEATISATQGLSDDNQLITDFEQFLQNLGVFKNDLGNNRAKVNLLKLDGARLISTQLQSEATAAQISLWPASVDKKLILTPDFNKSLVNATVLQNAGQLENYLELNFTYYPTDTTTFATYPIKAPDEAFDELKLGKGTVVVVPSKPQVSITSVSIGYFLGEAYSPYLQPVFVFEGPNFVAYVSAIRGEFQSQAK